jgi:hypothetical protein
MTRAEQIMAELNDTDQRKEPLEFIRLYAELVKTKGEWVTK